MSRDQIGNTDVTGLLYVLSEFMRNHLIAVVITIRWHLVWNPPFWAARGSFIDSIYCTVFKISLIILFWKFRLTYAGLFMVPRVWRSLLGSRATREATSLRLGGNHPLCLKLGVNLSLLIKYRCCNEPSVTYAGTEVQAGAQGPGIDWAVFLYPSAVIYYSAASGLLVCPFFCPT